MNEIEVVFVDAAGTLFEVRGSVGRIYSSIAHRYGIDADPDALERDFRKEFRAKSEQGFDCLDLDRKAKEKRWWFDVVAKVFEGRMPPHLLRSYFDEVFEFFRTAAAWRLFADTRTCLESLQEMGYRLGIISNFDSRLIDLLANLSLSHFFEAVVLSWHVGLAKPDPGIFVKGTESMQVDPSKAVHVGDSLEEDYYGACRAGLQAILLDSKGRYSHRTDLPHVSSLSDLCRLLEEKRA